MNHPGKVFLTLTAALLLLCPQIFAQEPSGEAAPPPAEQTDQDEDTNQLLQQFEKAPTLEGGTQKLYHIRNVNIHGAQYIDNSILRASSGLIPGDSIYLPSNFISTAITRLWNQRLFSDIRVGATIEGDSLDLEVFLKERPRVNYWRFEGISKSNQKDLLEKLKLKRGTELSDYVIDKNSKLIHKYYADKGFRNAEVSVRIDNDSILKQAVNVTFIVDRKRKIKIGEINFTGNEEFSDKRLRRTFKKTHQKSLNFFRGAKFNEEDFENDKELLLDFYNSKGFRNANIVADSIYAINDKRMGITLDISEGNKYYIRNVSWIGNSVYETDELARMFGVEKGSIYDKKSMYKRLGIGAYYNPDEPSITNLYKDQGYLTSQIDPAEIIIGKDSIDLEVRVFEGKQFTINNVGISGNMRLDDEVIRRELDGTFHGRSDRSGHSARRQFGRIGRYQLAARGDRQRPVPDRRRLGRRYVRGFGGCHTEQPLDQKLLQERRLETLPDGTEPAAVDQRPNQRYLLQSLRNQLHRSLDGRAKTELLHDFGSLFR